MPDYDHDPQVERLSWIVDIYRPRPPVLFVTSISVRAQTLGLRSRSSRPESQALYDTFIPSRADNKAAKRSVLRIVKILYTYYGGVPACSASAEAPSRDIFTR